MINCTIAYSRLKQQVQDLFDFAVAVCYAIPSLKYQIKNKTKGKTATPIIRPDFFVKDQSTPERIAELAHNYKAKLSSYILLSSFSFFEDYLIRVLNELVAFHGGSEVFIDLAEQRARKYVISLSPEAQKHKRTLQEPIKPSKIGKYQKNTNELLDLNYRFPTELLSAYGVRMLIQKVKNLKSKDIPELLQKGLHMELTNPRIEKFHAIRDMRNKIAHGEKVNLNLRQVMGMHKYLHELSKSIDKHLIEHFFVIEKFA